MTRHFALLFIPTSLALCQVDTQALVRKSVENCERDWQASAHWAWTQTDISVSEDRKQTTISEILPVGGTPYKRVVSRDGHPLKAEEERRELHKFEKLSNQRDHESQSDHEARHRKYENEWAFIKDIPNAYNFEFAGEQSIEGRPAWIIRMTPRAGFLPTEPHSALLQHFEGKLWIDKKALQWVKAEANAIDTVSIGWIVARIEPGAHFTVEQTPVANGLWMPRRLSVHGLARVMMVYAKNLNEDVTYSGYHLQKDLQAGTR